MALFQGLGKALRWLRQQKGLKQYEVAAAAGISKGMVSSYELDKQRPNLETLERLLEALGADLDTLYDTLRIVNDRPLEVRYGTRPVGEASAESGGAQPAEGGRGEIGQREVELIRRLARDFSELIELLGRRR